ncbi:DsbA family oxidoreductase [Cytobacillus purgationiresistens]|uniref:Protein disulfide-isomerase n=1 Tax=Cytobacillus purgationiresistens TaxID=863449 RepID=A0ABU0AB51_9BACI|nr:DsbA family oxidoreductase [Cytobacillus purgationiresistens]MDQ0268480.1 protein disulfide-isomerase [Cytobacillus purgationiresistens]
MKIEVWSDFVCPFCYIGKSRLENALTNFPFKDQVEVEYKAFELQPGSPVYSGKGMNEVLAEKYGTTVEQAKQMNENIKQQASEAGLTFNFDEMKPTNTFDAHRLAKFAKEKGKEAAITEKLLYGYFTESKLISDHDVLADIAEEIGLDRKEVLDVLADNNQYANDVRIDQALAQQYQITGVPFFIINQKYAISGAQPPETFASALKQVWEEENPAPKLQNLSSDSHQDATCTDGNCAIPEK